ncbi:YbaN family protein [Oricola thermophila]|uniref:YbaN family protein n=1 Tax=Oricola thermophila TaxID=2742145 RepID=A0A6N1VE40_9HYPH|nr:YbaN family protein [Oricola thermophila]QKV19241.1 YbaN family protein [Oricola thermophila]
MRLFWLAIGFLAVAAAAAGVVLPLLPTTPFLLVAAFAFARSSPRLEAWLLQHPRFGPLIVDWRTEGAIGRRTKAIALATMAATPGVTWALGGSGTILAIQVAVLSVCALFIASRPAPTRR